MTHAPDVRSLLREYHLDPHKGLGQNFLVDHGVLHKIVQTAGVQPQDSVLEIGAGLGSLTTVLAESCRHVVAVEIDKKLIPVLHEVLAPYPNVTLVPGDMLELDPATLMPEAGYQVVANIPYYITSAIIRHLLASSSRPQRLALTMQKEVAGRICAEAGEHSLLSLSVQVFGRPHVVLNIPSTAFYPQPKVDSSTLRIDLYDEPLIPEDRLETFFQLAHHGFAQKRKTLRNTLAAGMHISGDEAAHLLQAAGIDPTRRAQTLELPEWRTLVNEALDRYPELTKNSTA
ncbi:MAG: ribosomal RNA small subunit methyltransferase A [Anaerolineaceae bacterium]|nr:ribosomal RNA small subunit methyltransferase A [Anaerolineaceae bacterium]